MRLNRTPSSRTLLCRTEVERLARKNDRESAAIVEKVNQLKVATQRAEELNEKKQKIMDKVMCCVSRVAAFVLKDIAPCLLRLMRRSVCVYVCLCLFLSVCPCPCLCVEDVVAESVRSDGCCVALLMTIR